MVSTCCQELFDNRRRVLCRQTLAKPSPDMVGRGICFDSSVLLAAMLRAQGIPAKLAIGQLNTNGLTKPHAWNKVFIDGNWLKMDPTYVSEQIGEPDGVMVVDETGFLESVDTNYAWSCAQW